MKSVRKQAHFIELCDCLCRFVNAMQPRLQADVGPQPKYGVRP